VRSRGISTTEVSWAELLWKSGPLPPGNVLLSVPPLLEPLGTQANPLSTQLVRRLRALGYLSGDSNGTPAENALSDEKEPSTIPPVRPGEVGVRVR
jgi:hypothetical protein